jgi:hypothetical protein
LRTRSAVGRRSVPGVGAAAVGLVWVGKIGLLARARGALQTIAPAEGTPV